MHVIWVSHVCDICNIYDIYKLCVCSMYMSHIFHVCGIYDIYITYDIYLLYNLLWEYKQGRYRSQLFPPLLLYWDQQLLCTHTLLISSIFGHWGATCSQMRLALYHPDPLGWSNFNTDTNIIYRHVIVCHWFIA